MHLAMTYPQMWAAIAVIAPAAYGNRERLATAKDIPAYVVQGDQGPVGFCSTNATMGREDEGVGDEA